MRRIPSFLVGALATLVILVFYLGLHMPQPFLYSVEHEDALSQSCYCRGGTEELCYRLPENESVVGERFKCEFERYLKELGITSHSRAVDLEKDDLPVAPFVTAFSSSHYNEGLTLLSTIRKHFPTRKVIIYDLGIHPLRVNTLKSLCNVEYRRFPFELYPLHVRYLHEYRWKPLLIAAVLNEFGAIWYMDASVRYKKNSLEHIYDLLRCRRRPKPRIYHNLTVSRDSALETGWNREVWRRNLRECSKVPYMFHSFTGHGIYAATHPDVYRFIPTNINKLKAEKAKMYEAGLVFVVKTRDVVDKLLKWSVLCALQRECMGPVPFAAQCEFNGNDRYSTFAHCHRFDQSVINLLVANMAGYDRRFYASDIVDFFSIERHSPQQFNNLSLRCE